MNRKAYSRGRTIKKDWNFKNTLKISLKFSCKYFSQCNLPWSRLSKPQCGPCSRPSKWQVQIASIRWNIYIVYMNWAGDLPLLPQNGGEASKSSRSRMPVISHKHTHTLRQVCPASDRDMSPFGSHVLFKCACGQQQQQQQLPQVASSRFACLLWGCRWVAIAVAIASHS